MQNDEIARLLAISLLNMLQHLENQFQASKSELIYTMFGTIGETMRSYTP